MKNRPGRKRKRIHSTQFTSESSSIVRAVVGPEAKLFNLKSFLQHYTPSLVEPNLTKKSPVNERILRTLISPCRTLAPSPNIKKTECRESVPSFVDDIVWTLVQRRERLKSQGLDGRNVLAAGYSVASGNQHDGVEHSSSMPAGVVSNRENNIVTFCKTSRIFRYLHSHVGDEVLRMMLLHTSIFVPIDDERGKSGEKFMLICGPPCGNPVVRNNFRQVVNDPATQKLTASSSRVSKKQRRLPSKISSTTKPNSTISRYSLFYADSFVPKVGLPREHFLNRPRNSGTLLASIFSLHSEKGSKRKRLWKKLRVNGLGVTNEIIRRHSKCDYHRLLQRYCPVPEYCIPRTVSKQIPEQSRSYDVSGMANGVPPLSQLAAAFTPSENVTSFLAAVLRRVFPNDFWGSPGNFDSVLEKTRLFVNLRRKEKLPNKTLMNGIRVTKFSWLQASQSLSLSRTEAGVLNNLALKVLRWVFRSFIIPLLRSNFYITESEFTDKKVLFYRKPVWALFRSISLKKLLNSQFTQMSEMEARRRLRCQRMGFSRLRLLPKRSGVRPIADLSKPEAFTRTDEHRAAFICSSQGTGGRFRKKRKLNYKQSSGSEPNYLPKHQEFLSSGISKNASLRELFDVLMYEHARKPAAFGAGLDGLHDFHQRYRRFISCVKQTQSTSQPLRLYFASVDIQKCYDNIKQDYMLNVAKQQLSEEDYFIQQCSILRRANDNIRTLRRTFKKVVPPESYNPFHQTDWLTELSNGLVLMGDVKCSLAKKEEMVELLEEHLRSHLVVTRCRNGNRYLLQANGISQGSILSSLLCNLYYGDVEEHLLGEKFQHRWRSDEKTVRHDSLSLLARLVDDFILITTDKSALKKFLQSMIRGKPNLGVQVNEEKTRVNTAIQVFVDDKNQVPFLAGTERYPSGMKLFPWCGMLLDTVNGGVLVDYSRFSKGRARDSLTVETQGNEGARLKFRMKSFVKPRCRPIFFDSSINQLQLVVKNYYQMMLFAAVKTAEYLRSKSVLSPGKLNTCFLLQCIESLSSYSHRLIEGQLRRVPPTNCKRCNFILSRSTTIWLCWQAFNDVFSRLSDFEEQSRYISDELRRKGKHTSLRGHVALAFSHFQLHRMV